MPNAPHHLHSFPSVGKSTLLTKLTGTESEAAAYEFTTLTAIPGNLHYKGAKIQVLDLPGIIEGAKDGKGRGRQVISAACTCNVLLLVLDATKPLTHKRIIERELEGFGIRLNKSPPDIVLTRKERGGVTFRGVQPQKYVDEDLVRALCAEYRVPNADVWVRYPNATVDDIIDALNKNRVVYMPCLYVLNKIDAITIQELDLLSRVPHYVPISAKDEWNFDRLLAKIWEYAKMIRIYTKPRGIDPDFDEPVILHSTSPTIEEFCMRIHKGLLEQFKHAWVWGSSVKHQPQRVGKGHQLHDEDIVQIVKRVG